MRSIFFKCVLLAVLAFVLVSCQDHGVIPPPSDPSEDDPVKRFEVPFNPTDPEMQEYLADLWGASSHGEWDVIEGTINAETGGFIGGTPDSWPEEYSFGCRILAGAIQERSVPVQPRNWPLVDITIHVPRTLLKNGERPAVYLLEPDGLEFDPLKPAQLTFCYPPWFPARSMYSKFSFYYDAEEDLYYMEDWEGELEGEGCSGPKVGGPKIPGAPKIPCRLEIKFSTYHFSRWVLEEGGGTIGAKK